MSSASLLMFGEDWHGLPSSTQHLARQFMTRRHVTWVNSIGLRRPKLSLRDFGRAAGKLKRMLRVGGQEEKATVKRSPIDLVDPRAVSWPGSPVAGRLNRLLLGRQLRPHLDRQGIERPIVWASLPTAVDVLGTLDERAVVYYCCDDFGGLDGVDHDPVGRMEAELAEAADLVIAVNEELAAKFDPEKTIIIPHGVDLDLFTSEAPRAHDLPSGKVVGFYGSLADWIDVELIAETAALRPDWQFFLIGPVKTDVSALASCPNVILAGPRAHHELPSYSQHWQISLLPFRDTLQIRHCNPLKLREYLAAGRPVISTPCPAVEAYGAASIVRSGGELAAALDGALEDGAEENQRDLVAAESWEARAQFIDGLMDRL